MRILQAWSFTFTVFGSACIASVSGLCTFPEALRGRWMSSHAGLMNFTDDHVLGHTLHTAIQPTIDFRCETYNETLNKYLLKSTAEVTLFNVKFNVYLCIELHQISSYKFWYHLGSDMGQNPNMRLTVKGSTQTVGLQEVCTRAVPYDVGTFYTLVKEGAVEEGLAEATCPKDLFHKFSNGTLTNSAGDVRCFSGGLDACTDPTYRTSMNVTYDSTCDTSLKLADSGVSICLYDKVNEATGVRYLHVWNNDTTLKSGVQRINCYAYTVSEDGLNATLYPEACHEGQTDTYVNSGGVKLTYDVITASCLVTVHPSSQIAYYVAIIGGALGLILITILIVCLIKKTKCRCRGKNARVGHSESSLSSYMSTIESGEEEVTSSAKNKQTHLTKHGAALDEKTGEDNLAKSESDKKSRRRRAKRKGGTRGDLWVAKKPIKLGPIVEPYLLPPPKVELLYMVEPRPTSSRIFFSHRAIFESRASLRHTDEQSRPDNKDVGIE